MPSQELRAELLDYGTHDPAIQRFTSGDWRIDERLRHVYDVFADLRFARRVTVLVEASTRIDLRIWGVAVAAGELRSTYRRPSPERPWSGFPETGRWALPIVVLDQETEEWDDDSVKNAYRQMLELLLADLKERRETPASLVSHSDPQDSLLIQVLEQDFGFICDPKVDQYWYLEVDATEPEPAG